MPETPDPEVLRRFQEAVGKLRKVQREIFMAHRVHDMSYREIAERTGLTARQVERHIAKAIYKLAKHMDGRKLSWWERLF
jgi:RNA polymerase sigma-70 factor (ECF subfamily)